MENFCKVMTKDGFVRGLALDAAAIVEEARKIHDTTPVMTAALGRTLAAASMLGSLLKAEKNTLTLQIKGDGPAGGIMTVSDAFGNVRGYPGNPHVELPLNERGKLDVSGAVGREGTLTVIKDLNLKEPYIGRTPIVSGEIAEDVTHYLLVSEQTPSVVSLGVLVDRNWSVKQAGGFMLQLMPGAGEETISKLERAVAGVKPVTQLLDDGMSPEQILRMLLTEFEIEVLERSEKVYRCDCSRDRVERALISLGAKELFALAEEQGQTEVGCQFCTQKYVFTADELRWLASEGTGQRQS
ncbi:MAG: Hsp33 family molecular chaperone HslO [Clostridia bacterium]|nr:Hsp33 family molecular chaperone HslO [Clostridia bacterium]